MLWQRQKHKERESHIHAYHGGNNQDKEHYEVDGVHDGRANVHAHSTDILANSSHQIASVVATIKGGG